MLGRVFERLLDAQAGWAKPLGDWVHGLTAAIFGRMLPIRDFLAGTWLGHPRHALLTDVPIGAFTLVIVLDVIGQPAAAHVVLLIGVLSMLAATIAGYADYSTTDGAARAHAGGPVSAGTIVDGCVECPWHGSRFELTTGTRRRGPTVYDQPRYEIQVPEGGYKAKRVS